MTTVTWKTEPEQHDYPAAASYLSLLASAELVAELVGLLEGAHIQYHKAKDILRAAALPLLPADDPHVASDLRKVDRGKELSPILLVRGDLERGLPLQIADGYHRVCASYHIDENTDIPCHLVARPE
ncbi:MAG TPA: hypothetical protein VJ870_17625 [Amycolatopsis sp.]|nr:hypothetical protein [Amycolatopsis sp.]